MPLSTFNLIDKHINSLYFASAYLQELAKLRKSQHTGTLSLHKSTLAE